VNNFIKIISKVKSDYLKLILSTILGVACGAAWMTNIRYYRIGISELFFFIFFIILFFINKVDFFKIKKNLLSIVKFFLFFLLFLIAPYKTFFENLYGLLPENLIIYHFSFFLFFFTLIALKKKIIDLNLVSLIFAIIFLFTLFFYLFIDNVIFEIKKRLDETFLGLSNNPNQISFYLLSLLFFLSFGNKYFFFYFFLVLFILSFYFQSDAFLLSSISIVISFLFFYLKIFFLRKKKAVIFFSLIMFLIILMSLNFTQILTFAIKYFEGSETRILLLKNGLLSILNSPLLGNGVGSFSGYQAPFEGYEIHNTFLDFASQFGFFFLLLVCGVMLLSLYLMIVKNNFLSAASLVGLLVFINFHYIGRHFIFYVILAILCNYIANFYKTFFLFKSKGNF
jgi:hypothetical protein